MFPQLTFNSGSVYYSWLKWHIKKPLCRFFFFQLVNFLRYQNIFFTSFHCERGKLNNPCNYVHKPFSFLKTSSGNDSLPERIKITMLWYNLLFILPVFIVCSQKIHLFQVFELLLSSLFRCVLRFRITLIFFLQILLWNRFSDNSDTKYWFF